MNPVDILRLLSLAAIWGASFLFMRIIAPVIGTIPTAFFRVSIAFVGLLVILALMRVDWNFRGKLKVCLLYTSPSPRDGLLSRMPSSA